jgi:hypothetical protein
MKSPASVPAPAPSTIPTTAASTPTAVTTATNTCSTENDVITSPAKPPLGEEKKKRNICKWKKFDFTSQNYAFSFTLPSSLVIVPDSDLKSLEKDKVTLKQLRDETQGEKFTVNSHESKVNNPRRKKRNDFSLPLL